MLDVSRIVKRFAPGKAVLQGVSLSVAREELVCLLGPSGCGKSTLLRIIAGLERADEGQVWLDGKEITDMPPHRRGIGLMFQDYALFPHLTVAGNIAYGLRMQGVPEAARPARVEEMLALVNLEGYGGRSVGELSGGEQQRVALARVLAPEPALLLLDEPVANLDRLLREELVQELRRILRQLQMTAIVVTHDQEEAFVLADRVAVMRAGRIEQVEAPAQLYRRPANTFVAGFLGFQNLLPVVRDGREAHKVRTCAGEFLISVGNLSDDRVCRLLIPPDAAVMDGEPPAGSYVAMTATVVAATFRGSVIRLQVVPEVSGAGPEGGDAGPEAGSGVPVVSGARPEVGDAAPEVGSPVPVAGGAGGGHGNVCVLSFEFRNRGRERVVQPGERVQLWVDTAQMSLVREG